MMRDAVRRLAMLALLLASVQMPAFVDARIFSCQDSSGRVILRDVPCKRAESPREQEVKQEAPAPARAAEPRAQPKQPAKLNEAQVKDVAQSVDTAFGKRDMKPLLAVLANDAVFEMEIRAAGTVQVFRYNREDYANRLREGFKLGNDFAYQRSRSDVMLAPGDEYAEIVAWAQQSFWFQNQWQQGDVRSRWSVEMREGRPQITLLRATATAPQP